MAELMMKFHDILHSPVFGIRFLLFIFAFYYSVKSLKYLKNKNLNELPLIKRGIHIASIVYITILIGDFMIAGDIYRDTSPASIAGTFVDKICTGQINENLKKNNERYLASFYFDKFKTKWHNNESEIKELFSNREYYPEWRESLIKENESYHNKDYNESYKVSYRIRPIAKRDYEFDVLYNVSLNKVYVKSRLLGEYERWRITNFSFQKRQRRGF